MRKELSKLTYLSLALLMGMGLAACGGKKVAKAKTPDDTENKPRTTNPETQSVRYCDPDESPINNSSTSKLSDFFSEVVSELEGAPSFCHEISGFGSTVDMNLMIEFEDRRGITSTQFDAEKIVSRKLATSVSDSDHYVLDIIYRDDFGLVRVNAKGPKSTGVLTGNIFYYNFPSYEEALTAEIEKLRKQCQSGQKTVYECMGYTYPTQWWNQPLQTSEGQRVKEMALEIMNSASKRKHLGAIALDIGASTFPN